MYPKDRVDEVGRSLHRDGQGVLATWGVPPCIVHTVCSAQVEVGFSKRRWELMLSTEVTAAHAPPSFLVLACIFGGQTPRLLAGDKLESQG